MFNRPTSPWTSQTSTSAGWPDVDRDPQIRLILLWLILVIPIVMIGGRLIKVQIYLKDGFSEEFSQTYEEYEDIPARDGRIFAADRSTVLADDILRYDVAVYYPAILNPPDDAWLNSKALQRLAKTERRNKARVAAEKQKIVEELEHLWTRLAALTNRPLNELLDARKREQDRVQRIIDSVERRFNERMLDAEKKKDLEIAQADSVWKGFWLRIERAFAESPRRNRSPRPIKEEEWYYTVIKDVTEDMKLEIESNREKYPYTHIIVNTRRTYPQGELAAHLIGVRKPMTEEQLKSRKENFHEGDPLDYHAGDPYGLFGLEQSYDSVLKGVRGRRVLVKNRHREIVESREDREPRHGRDLILTLDSDVQRQAEKSLDEALKHVTLQGESDPEATNSEHPKPTCPQGGCIVAMDVHTGAIIAAASAPRYDLNLYITHDTEMWEDVMSDKRGPLFPRVTQMALPPGSVFKIISAVASIESGKMPPDATFHCQGYLDRPTVHRCMPFRHYGIGHHDVTLADALCRSCNVYFYTAARRMGPQYLVDWARKFGIGQRTGIDLPSESAGHLPAPDAVQSTDKRNQSWKPGKTLDLAIGQSDLTVTPLQMVRAIAAVANDGYLVVPHLAANAGPTSTDVMDSVPSELPQIESHAISGLHRGTLDHVREGLNMVVQNPSGTGYKTVRMKQVTIAGKTGTAETSGVDHAWFAGYVPAERPRIAFVVVLEHGGGGGKAAGPVAHQFVKSLLEHQLIEKSTTLASDRSTRLNSD